MGWNGHPIFLRRQFQFLENWWNMKHIHSISIWSSEIWPVLASSCQVRWPGCPLLSMAARKQPTSKAARFQRLLTGCAGWRLIAIIHYYSDDLSGTQFQRRTFPLQLTLTFLNTQKWSHPKPTSTICQDCSRCAVEKILCSTLAERKGVLPKEGGLFRQCATWSCPTMLGKR
jgi:hypothetical protein